MRLAYERVRAAALTGEGWRWGRSVLARAGVAGWMRAWREHASADGEASRGAALVRGASRQAPTRAPDVVPGVAVGTPGMVGESEPVVTLLALMLRGLLEGRALEGPGGTAVRS